MPSSTAGWAAALTDGQRVSAKRLVSVAGRVGTATGVHIPVSLYRVLFGGGMAAATTGPASSSAAASVLSQPVSLDALLERLCEHFERVGDRLEAAMTSPSRVPAVAGGVVGGGSGVGGGGSVGGVIGGPLTADSRNLSSKLSLSSLARSTSKAKFVSVASSASLEPHKDLTALVDRQEEEHRQEVEEQQLGTTFNPSFNLSIPNRSYLNTVPSQLSVPRDDSVPYVNSYVPSGGVPGSLAGSGGDVMSHVTGSGGGWPSTNGGGWGAPDLPAAGERGNDGGRHQWPGADPRARGNKSLLEFVGDILYRKGPPRERWKLGRKLGEGGNSRVYEAVHVHDGTRAAVKVIDKQLLSADQAERRLWYEVYAFKLLGMSGGHPNIVELLEVGEDAEYVYLCMELLVGGELFSRITDQGQYTEKHAAALVEAMLSALRLCHDLNITHRDVKPENWVFTDTGPDAVVKLIDFGICFYSEDPTALCRSIIGTPLYVAPEVLLRQPYGPEADLWSLGVIVYIMLSGRPPFDDIDQVKLIKKIKYHSVEFAGRDWVLISEEGKDFLSRLLHKDPSDRMDAKQALKHRWLKNNRNEATTANLFNVAQTNVIRYNAMKRWKAAIHLVQALNRMQSGIVSSQPVLDSSATASGNLPTPTRRSTPPSQPNSLRAGMMDVAPASGSTAPGGGGGVGGASSSAASPPSHAYIDAMSGGSRGSLAAGALDTSQDVSGWRPIQGFSARRPGTSAAGNGSSSVAGAGAGRGKGSGAGGGLGTTGGQLQTLEASALTATAAQLQPRMGGQARGWAAFVGRCFGGARLSGGRSSSAPSAGSK
ncbi:hypothetical protein I4F81_004019 [Pyropia yezoensis]|uniref:Uncharacterized protein n=1 Tax=Pyropia yezoensis TaxID=2788 RepID=A0ACC3BU04_PYRYE|nr:hypothetical protein I4F81_004019 [Neopyropia yezoensis]